jgi:hypothetical protein
MKPYLVDVPVLLFVFIRPETISRVFEVIREARPSTLFLVSDGPRSNVSTDKEQIESSRRIVENIDWDCKVYKLYFDENQGLYNTVKKAFDFTFKYVDRCIFLEDDVVTSISFFQFCAELLEKYKDDSRINMICGMNHMEKYEEPNSDYFFSEAASIWGFALWRRTYESFYDFNYGDDNYVMTRIKENAKEYKKFSKALDGYYKSEYFDGHIAGPEFFLRFIMFSQNQINIIPKNNMIKNIGFTEGSTHAANNLKKMPKGTQQMFNMNTYEYKFPLKHPKYVILDRKYEKKINRIMGKNYPVIHFYRRCEGIIRRIYFGDSKLLIKKIYDKIRFVKRIEH